MTRRDLCAMVACYLLTACLAVFALILAGWRPSI